jgi:3-deoxy-manno-octulosonate cytidylyltransferase (CMP-KDO synthetase)
MQFGPVVVITASYHDLRFPGKALVPIKGASLLERTYRRALLCPHVATCLIVTDDSRIADHASSFDAKTVLIPPTCTTNAERVFEAILLQQDLQEAPLLVTLQASEPCIDPHTISKVIQTLILNPHAHIGTIVTPLQSNEDLCNPNIIKCVRSLNGTVLYLSRQTIPSMQSESSTSNPCYLKQLPIFSYRPDFLMKYAKLSPTPLELIEGIETLRALEYGHCVVATEVQKQNPVVDVPKDIEEVENWIENQSFPSYIT